MRAATRVALGGVGALATQRALQTRPPGGASRWLRTNHRGQPVSLSSGPALAAAAGLAALGQPAGLLAGLGAGAVGAYDDMTDAADASAADFKGLRGHADALAAGQVTSGTVKVIALAGLGLVTAVLSPGRSRLLDRLVGGAVVAGSANLLNLFDLRPGRALKVGLGGALVLREPGIAAACLALLPGDLGERTMLGDAGANALGATLGTTFLRQQPSRAATVSVLAGLVGLTALSEVCSFSALIDRIPVLHWADELGRPR